MISFSGQFRAKYFPVIKVINSSKTQILKALLCINILICLFITFYHRKLPEFHSKKTSTMMPKPYNHKVLK